MMLQFVSENTSYIATICIMQGQLDKLETSRRYLFSVPSESLALWQLCTDEVRRL